MKFDSAELVENERRPGPEQANEKGCEQAEVLPSAAKAALISLVLCGTTEVVPFQNSGQGNSLSLMRHD